jgi:predicted ATPase
MRYRLLETVRQYALEKLGEPGDADAVRARHRDYYTAMAALLDARADRDYEQRIEQAETEGIVKLSEVGAVANHISLMRHI